MEIRFKILPELQRLIPPLSSEEYEQLEKNLLSDGVRDPLVIGVYPDENGEEQRVLIDGHNRYNITGHHDLKYTTVDRLFKSFADLKEWMILNQFGRRNINRYQRSELALLLEDHYKIIAKKNQRGGQGGVLLSQISEKAIDTHKELAKTAKVSHDTIAKVKAITQKADEETKQKLRTGEVSINKVYQDIRRQEKKEEVLKKAEEVNQVLSLESSNEIDIYNTDKRFNIIYADPPWQYWEGGQKNQSLHYPTMTIEQLKKLPIQSISEDDCILFLWVTYPILKESLDLIESWGFKYSTCGFVWVKKNKNTDTWFFGNGAWTRANSELCLIAKKGNPIRMDASVSQVLDDCIMGHSEKPYRVRQLITKLMGELPRIELFSRRTEDDGWFNWGNKI